MGGKIPCRSMTLFYPPALCNSPLVHFFEREGAQLSHQAQLVPIVPGFCNLAVCKTLHANAGCSDFLARRSDAKKRSGVCHRDAPPRHHHVLLLDGLVDLDVNGAECGAKAMPECFEGLGADDIGTVVSLPVTDRFFRTKLIDGFFAALVPDLFEPAAY